MQETQNFKTALADPRTWVSFLVSDHQLFYATQPIRTDLKAPPPPLSSMTRLIQGVYEHLPDQARKICRARIFSNQTELTPFCRGMIRVAAKRMTQISSSELQTLPHDFSLHFHNLTHWDHQPTRFQPGELKENFVSQLISNSNALLPLDHWIEWTRTLVAKIPLQATRYQSDRPVVALLLAFSENEETYQLLGAARNQNAKNRTLHAEVNLIQNWYRSTGIPIPKNTVILTSLKPCRMCAGLIWQSSLNPKNLRVYYLENDPGPYAQNTALEPNTADRRLSASTTEELRHEILKKV